MLKLLTTCWHCITLWIVGNVNMHSRTRDIHTRWAKLFVASHSPPYGETPNLVQQPCNKSHIVVFTQDIFVILFAWDHTRIRWDITMTKYFEMEIWKTGIYELKAYPRPSNYFRKIYIRYIKTIQEYYSWYKDWTQI